MEEAEDILTTAFWDDRSFTVLGTRALLLVITWLVVWLISRYIGKWILKLIQQTHDFTEDPAGFTFMRRVLRGLVIGVGVFLSLAILGLTPVLAGMLTTFGVVGIVVGLAIKDVAANFVSGVLLVFDRPFKIGDFVSAGNVQGHVETISLRSTRIRTLEGPLVMVPNSVIAANAITNFSASANRRQELIWKLPLNTDMDAAGQVLLELAADEPGVAEQPAPQVVLGDLRDDSFDLKLIYYAPNDSWLDVQSDMKRALVEHLRQQTAAEPETPEEVRISGGPS